MNIGGYETIRLLGKGGMSEVYEVENPRLGSRHALKRFTYDKDDPDVRERFMVEGRLLSRLSHPRIVHVTDIGTDAADGRPFFVMDLILDESGTARSLADVGPGTVDEETIGRWYDDLRDGLAYIHAHGVVHRDLKLQNVLIGPDGHAVLTDFGISRVFDAKNDGEKIVDTVKTIVKMREGRSLVMGSIGYMAPELEMGVAASPQSDWYALGVIVYRLLTGTWCDARTDVASILESYDPVWRRIIPKLLHSNPDGRECLSYAEEKSADRDRADARLEERWLAAKGRGHFARHLARYLGVLAGFCALAFAFLWLKYDGDRKLWDAERRRLEQACRVAADGEAPPWSFDALFKIPPEAKSEEVLDDAGELIMPSREGLASARLDALVLTHDMFSRLAAGGMTVEQLSERLERLRDGFAEDVDMPFDLWPDGYSQCGADEDLHWLLGLALERLEAMSAT